MESRNVNINSHLIPLGVHNGTINYLMAFGGIQEVSEGFWLNSMLMNVDDGGLIPYGVHPGGNYTHYFVMRGASSYTFYCKVLYER